MYSSYVFISENRKLLPAFGHHMFMREDFSQDKDISAIKIKPGIPIVFFSLSPALSSGLMEYSSPSKWDLKKRY